MKYISRWSGDYRAPARMMGWLEERLAGERFRVQAAAIAVLVMRAHTAPKRIGQGFCLSRPEVAKLLGFKDWETRQAIKLLVTIGFLDAEPPEDNRPRKTARGVRRPPIIYRLCSFVLGYFRKLLFRRSPECTATRGSSSSLKGKEGNLPEGVYSGESPMDRAIGHVIESLHDRWEKRFERMATD